MNPKSPDAYEMVLMIQQAASMLINLLDQINAADEHYILRLTLIRLDRIEREHDRTEMIRAKISVELQPDESRLRAALTFYILRPDECHYKSDWYLSSNGKDPDTPAEIFHKFLQDLQDESHRQLVLGLE